MGNEKAKKTKRKKRKEKKKMKKSDLVRRSDNLHRRTLLLCSIRSLLLNLRPTHSQLSAKISDFLTNMEVVNGYVVKGAVVNVLALTDLMREELGELEQEEAATGKSVRKVVELLEGRGQGESQLIGMRETLRDVADRAWEHLHLGDWKSVKMCWRSAYSYASILLARLESLRGNWKEAMRLFDLVLLMGSPPWHQAAQDAIRQAPIDASMMDDDASLPLPDWPDDAACPPLAIAPPLLAFPRVYEYETSPSLSEFEERHLKAGVPCIIRGLANSWPAMSKWKDTKFLSTLMAGRTVPIELGKHYMDESFSQQLMPFNSFLRKHVIGSSDTVGYLAQTQLLEQVPELMRDLLIPDYCAMVEHPCPPTINAWVGPAGTTSPLHTDPQENIFVQIVGRKAILLHSPSENDCLYPTEGLMSNTSQIDAEHPDFEAFPRYASVKGQLAIVGPGDALFIPRGTWHFVKSLQPSWSLSFWFGEKQE